MWATFASGSVSGATGPGGGRDIGTALFSTVSLSTLMQHNSNTCTPHFPKVWTGWLREHVRRSPHCLLREALGHHDADRADPCSGLPGHAGGRGSTSIGAEVFQGIARVFRAGNGGSRRRTRCPSSRWSSTVMKEVLLRAAQGRPSRQAPRPLLKLLWSMERFILSEAALPFLRVHTWWKCLQSWGVLRFDDHHGFHLHQFVLDGRRFGGDFAQDQDDGVEGKEVSLRPFFISRSSWVGECSLDGHPARAHE